MFTMKTKIDKLIKSFKNPLKVHSFKLKSDSKDAKHCHVFKHYLFFVRDIIDR